MIRIVMPASLALHVALLVVLPNAKTRLVDARRDAVVEIASAPELEPPTPPPEREPEPEPEPQREPAAPTTAPASRARPAKATTTALAGAAAGAGESTDDRPADFTSTLLSNEGSEGVDVAAGGGPAHAPARPTPGVPASLASPSGPRFVAVTALARAPRAPGLDAELERNYPPDAKRAGVSGKAVLRVQVLADGRIARVVPVSETYGGFAEACERTVRAARWEPPIDAEGRPAATEITYVCRFEVRT